MEGTLFNIQKFSINDGPGIRTTVFLKGCPLSCIWCHNPESKKASPEIFFNRQKCTSCGKCAAICKRGAHIITCDGRHEYDRQKCSACGVCAEGCYLGGLELVGEVKDVGDVIKEVMKDKLFYDTSGGGVTLSGGEPMMQFDFAYGLLKAAKADGIHTCMETCGFADEEKYRKIAPLVDIFLFDYKETDPKRHREYTGVDNGKILSNLRMLDEMGAKTVLRCPIIPTLNDRPDHFLGIAKTANSLKNVLEINVEPYHPLGSGKSEMLDRDYPLADLTFPDDATVAEWIKMIQDHTTVIVKKA